MLVLAARRKALFYLLSVDALNGIPVDLYKL